MRGVFFVFSDRFFTFFLFLGFQRRNCQTQATRSLYIVSQFGGDVEKWRSKHVAVLHTGSQGS